MPGKTPGIYSPGFGDLKNAQVRHRDGEQMGPKGTKSQIVWFGSAVLTICNHRVQTFGFVEISNLDMAFA